MENVIQVNHLSHHYGKHQALDSIDFHVQRGEVMGLLGPNGAGKTTAIRLLNGLFSPTSGTMQVLGLDPVTQGDQIRQHTGVLTETPALYERLTALENLQFFGTLAGLDDPDLNRRIDELLEFFELTGRSNERVGNYSKGMKQRLALARALLHHPRLVFLDEPTSGLDPEAAQQVHELMRDIRQQNGQSILLCTHHLYEAERLCDRVAILNNGRLLAAGSLEELREAVFPGLRVQIDFLTPLPAEVLDEIASLGDVDNVEIKQSDSIQVQIQHKNSIPSLVTWLVEQNTCILSVNPYLVSLEEIYFKLQQEAGS